MGDFLMSRARRLFQYADLQSSHDESGSDGPMATCATARRKKVLLIGGLATSVLLIVIVAAGMRHSARPALQTAPEADYSKDFRPGSSHLMRSNLHDLVYGTFYGRKFNGTWVSDTEILYLGDDFGFNVHNVEDESKSYQIMSPNMTRVIRPLSFHLSADKTHLLIKRSSVSVYKRSSYGKYSILRLNRNGRSGTELTDLKGLLRVVKWAPTGNGLAYVDFDNNLYVKRSVKASPEQLTNDGVPGVVFNGVPDWVFEEEVFEDNAALWWSPDASQIVWGAFDDTDVEIYDLPTYGTWQKFKQYPDVKELRYPKVNTTNPKSTLWVADLRPDQRFSKHPVHPPKDLGKHFSI